MRKISLLIFIALSVLILNSCNINIYSGLYPNDYGPSKWICNDSDSWFIVNNKGDMQGELEVDGESLEFELQIDFTPNAYLYHEGNIILQGECSLLPDQLAIKINYVQDCIYGYDREILVFNRISYLPGEEGSSLPELASFSPPN